MPVTDQFYDCFVYGESRFTGISAIFFNSEIQHTYSNRVEIQIKNTSEPTFVINKAIVKLVTHWHVVSQPCAWSIDLASCVGQIESCRQVGVLCSVRSDGIKYPCKLLRRCDL